MPPLDRKPDFDYQFIAYLQFISDMLGGDIFPIRQQQTNIRKLISERAIDYTLITRITAEIQKHNAILKPQDHLEPYPTLDALGSIRASLLDNQGDIHQISLLDRIGELTVSFFNLKYPSLKPEASAAPVAASVHSISRKRPC